MWEYGEGHVIYLHGKNVVGFYSIKNIYWHCPINEHFSTPFVLFVCLCSVLRSKVIHRFIYDTAEIFFINSILHKATTDWMVCAHNSLVFPEFRPSLILRHTQMRFWIDQGTLPAEREVRFWTRRQHLSSLEDILKCNYICDQQLPLLSLFEYFLCWLYSSE